MLGDARMDGGFLTGIPNRLVRDGSVLVALTCTTGKKINARLLPAPILAQRHIIAVSVETKRTVVFPSSNAAMR